LLFSKLHIFTGFVQDITGIQLEIDKVEMEKEFTPPIGRVQSRFDLFAEDKKNRVIVDIQHVRFPDHYHRFLHYHCAAILEQAATAKNYRPHCRVFTIVLFTSSDHHQKDITRIDFDPKDLQGRGINEIQHQVLYLSPPYVTDVTPEPYRQWLMAIKDSLDGEVNESAYSNPLIQEIFRTIEVDVISPEERFLMKDEFGYEEIKQEKFQEVRREAMEDAALGMLKEGVSQAVICKVTGLSAGELVALVMNVGNGIEVEVT
jgi:hypothetical protein